MFKQCSIGKFFWTVRTTTEEIERVPLSAIVKNPNQPRKRFSPEELAALAESIRCYGIIQPPVVRPLPGGQYELVAGERRIKASALAGLEEIPVVVRRASDQVSAFQALIENVQRVDLNPIEVAEAIQELVEFGKLEQEEVAERIGKKRSTIANYLRLLQLPGSVREMVANNELSMGQAKVVLSLSDPIQQTQFAQEIIDSKWTVREAERMVERKKSKPCAKPQDIYMADLERQMEAKLATRVRLQGKGERGKIVIEYVGLDDLDRLLEFLT